jgi:hypothetical protein
MFWFGTGTKLIKGNLLVTIKIFINKELKPVHIHSTQKHHLPSQNKLQHRCEE